MRTTVNIDDQLLLKAKKQAVASGVTLSSVIDGALRSAFLNKQLAKRVLVTLVTEGGTGLKHGIDLDNNQSLSDAMED